LGPITVKNLIYDQYRKLIRESKFRWLIILGSALYILSPIDISPDLIPIVGWIDDGVVVTLLLTEVSAILMEKLKEKKTASTSDQPEDSKESDDQTIDVDSVRVK
jgi:uncharacterized membrane protein YkvA (DUF1232 family)